MDDLIALFTLLFSSEGALYRYIALEPAGNRVLHDLRYTDTLPELVPHAAWALLRHGCLVPAFFDRLNADFPAYRDHIGEVASRFVLASPAGGSAAGVGAGERSVSGWDEALERALLHCLDGSFDRVVGAELLPKIASSPAKREQRVFELGQLVRSANLDTDPIRQRLRVEGALPDIEAWRQMMRVRVDLIPVIGFSQAQGVHVPHDALFIELALSAERGHPSDAEPAPIRETLTWAQAWRSRDKSLRGIAVVGPPGAGKTMLLRHIYREVDRHGSASLGLEPDLVPVPLDFGRLAKLATDAKGLDDVFERHTADDAFPGVGRALLGTRPAALFLIDGLDEVNTTDELDQVCGWLVRELDRWKASFFVLSCRTHAWDAFLAPLGSRFARASVQWLSASAVDRYVRSWFEAVYEQERPGDGRAGEDAARLLSTLLVDGARFALGWERLARTPLILGIICLVHHRKGKLPEGRNALYEALLEVLLSEWARHRAREERAASRSLDHRKVVRCLAPAAFHAQSRGDGQDVADLPEAELFSELEEAIAERGLRDQSAESLARALESDCGLLTRARPRVWRFVHLNLQEYLAASHLFYLHAAQKPLDGRSVVSWLVDRRAEQRWKEPTLLALGREDAALFGPWLHEMLTRPDPAQGEPLLHEAVLERGLPELGPLRTLFADAMAPQPRPPEDLEVLRLALGLLALGPVPAGLRGAVEALRGHADAGVRDRVFGLLGGAESAQPGARRWGEIRVGARASVELGAVRMTFVGVPPGEFWMGATRKEGARNYDAQATPDEAPVHRVRVERGFWLGQTPVTNAQYSAYCEATGALEPPSFADTRFNDPNMPVVTVSWHDANTFCHWLGERLPTGFVAELPTEEEWEYAARGPMALEEDGRRYPWGDDDPDPRRAVFHSAAMAAAGQRRAGTGPFGAKDQAGLVREWCGSVYLPYELLVGNDARHDDDKGRRGDDAWRVLRGGSWFDYSGGLRCARRVGGPPQGRSQTRGFRVLVRCPKY